MDSLSKKIQNLGIHDIRNAARFAQNVIVQYEPYQVDIRRATNTDSWGPTPKHLFKVMRNKYQVPLHLMTEYTLKRLVDHIASRPKNLYEKARKQYVNYGNEWRVVLKCLVVLEYLLLNVDSGSEVDQVIGCLTTHKRILSRDVMQFRVDFSADGKMEVHERGIKKKCEQILQYLEDPSYLKRERAKHSKNAVKIHRSAAAFPSTASMPGTSGEDAVYGSYDDDDDDEDDEELRAAAAAPAASRRRASAVDEQRRQKREMLREKIKASELQRKASIKKAQEPPVDLLAFDEPEPQTQLQQKSPLKNGPLSFGSGGNADDDDDGEDDDDEFGDFQGDSHLQSTTAATSTNTTSNMDSMDLLNWDGPSGAPTGSQVGTGPAATNGSSNSSNQKDAFADLFSYSKTHV